MTDDSTTFRYKSARVCTLSPGSFQPGAQSDLSLTIRYITEECNKSDESDGFILIIETDPSVDETFVYNAGVQAEYEAFYAGLSWMVQQAAKPIVGGLVGRISGAASLLALVLDGLAMDREALLQHPYRTQGIAVGGGTTKRLTVELGPVWGREFILLGRPVTADEALRWGLVNAISERNDLLDSAARLLSQRVQHWDEVIRRRDLLRTSAACQGGVA